ncbi:hypothetical protein D1AOALGA4SA_198 [Olavius algarvensis Delta 1 endosymbiont]|nr:hypothetical protein D1AOALGA4SA_198 [Olavius algarvensis Delta 1 endosymbiont]
MSGVRCQQLKSTRFTGIAHALNFLSRPLTFRFNPIRVQGSDFVFASYET